MVEAAGRVKRNRSFGQFDRGSGRGELGRGGRTPEADWTMPAGDHLAVACSLTSPIVAEVNEGARGPRG
jgi:hypothetical protein